MQTAEHAWGLLVELCAPEVRNALDRATVRELTAIFRSADPGVVVLAAQGTVFCAGGDLATLSTSAAAGTLEALFAEAGSEFGQLVETIVTCPRPVVVALRGAAIGGGMALALAGDVRIAASSARLVPGWGRWGLPPDGGASALLALALGPGPAASVLVRGQTLDTSSALAHLVFDEVVADQEVLARAVLVAEQLAAHSGARSAKAVTRSLLLPVLKAQQERELVALVAAARDPAVQAALARLPVNP